MNQTQRNPNSFKQCGECGIELVRCDVCAKTFPALRADSTTCSNNCRQRKKYRADRARPARDDHQEVTR